MNDLITPPAAIDSHHALRLVGDEQERRFAREHVVLQRSLVLKNLRGGYQQRMGDRRKAERRSLRVRLEGNRRGNIDDYA
ncbi:hypothetical protein CKO09_05810 [Chromatium weissei]|nr:hypothetical protein [Chromatium weissei]